jgi:hypothetical protein
MNKLSIFLLSFFLISCGSTITITHESYSNLGNKREKKDWTKNTAETIATVTNRRSQEEVMVEVLFKTQKGELIKKEFDLSRSFGRIVVGDKFKVLYDIDSPRNFLFFVYKQAFDFDQSKSLFVNAHEAYCSSYRMQDSTISACELQYKFTVTDKNFKSQTSMIKEDFLKLNFRNNKDKYYRVHYNKESPQINWLDYFVPYEVKENSSFITSDIGRKTKRELNKVARKLNSGGTLFWTTSKIDFSDDAEVNQEELTKMKQFLKTYEPKGFLGRKLDVKVEIVDHRNIGEVLVPVEREIEDE